MYSYIRRLRLTTNSIVVEYKRHSILLENVNNLDMFITAISGTGFLPDFCVVCFQWSYNCNALIYRINTTI